MIPSGFCETGRWVSSVVVAAACAMAASDGARAQGTDDLFEVTVRMEIPGMGMQMPATTQRSCVKKGASDAAAVPHQDNCAVTDARRTGNKLTFAIACTGRDAMSGTGEFTYAGEGYQGTIRFNARMEGHDMQMTQSIAGRRVGSCTAR